VAVGAFRSGNTILYIYIYADLFIKINKTCASLAAPALRTPLSIAGSYAPFAMMGHHEMNGSLTSPGVYPGLISPQMSAAAAAAYGRSPIVSTPNFTPSSFSQQ